eukprot:scpid34683/ scgid13043/ 
MFVSVKIPTLYTFKECIQLQYSIAQYTVHSAQYTVHSAQCTVHSTQYSIALSCYTCTCRQMLTFRLHLFHAAAYLSFFWPFREVIVVARVSTKFPPVFSNQQSSSSSK